jgi:hypothetical protein
MVRKGLSGLQEISANPAKLAEKRDATELQRYVTRLASQARFDAKPDLCFLENLAIERRIDISLETKASTFCERAKNKILKNNVLMGASSHRVVCANLRIGAGFIPPHST